MKEHNYYVYILTNKNKKVLYTGVTNSLDQRLTEHYFAKSSSFTGKYNCHYLLYYEHFQYINRAIEREKQIKGWLRKKKEELINSVNPEWRFLNEDVMRWPPKDSSLRSE